LPQTKSHGAKIAWFSRPRSERGRIEWHTNNIAKLAGSMLPKHDPQIEAGARSFATINIGLISI
jgi:hypothetical protein